MQPSDDDRFKAEMLVFIPRLRAFARTLTGRYAAADDLAQETVMRAWRARASFELGTNMEGWLFRILRNAHISGLRRDRMTTDWGPRADEAERNLPSIDDPSATVHLNDLRQALNRLTREQREALVLVGASGWSYEEAAEHAGCPVGTMKSRVFRARRILATYVEQGCITRDGIPASQAAPTLMALATATEDRRDEDRPLCEVAAG